MTNNITSNPNPNPQTPRPPRYLFIHVIVLLSITSSYQNPNPSIVRSSCMRASHDFPLCMCVYLARVSFPANCIFLPCSLFSKISLYSKMGLRPTTIYYFSSIFIFSNFFVSLNLNFINFQIVFINILNFIPNLLRCDATHHLARNSWCQSTYGNIPSL
jgi:hypothetical protein